MPAMANTWFESVAVAQRRAKRFLPKSVYGALVAGTERGQTMDDNLAAFTELHGPADVDAGDHLADRRAGRPSRR
jgi:pre-mycofactocin synthase